MNFDFDTEKFFSVEGRHMIEKFAIESLSMMLDVNF